MKRIKEKWLFVCLVFLISVILPSCGQLPQDGRTPSSQSQTGQKEAEEAATLADIPAYTDQPYVEINQGKPEFTEEEEIEETPAETPKKVSRVSQTTEKLEGLVDFDDDPAETKTESEPEEVMVDDDLIINDPFADEDDLLGEEKTETKGSEKEVLGDAGIEPLGQKIYRCFR